MICKWNFANAQTLTEDELLTLFTDAKERLFLNGWTAGMWRRSGTSGMCIEEAITGCRVTGSGPWDIKNPQVEQILRTAIWGDHEGFAEAWMWNDNDASGLSEVIDVLDRCLEIVKS